MMQNGVKTRSIGLVGVFLLVGLLSGILAASVMDYVKFGWGGTVVGVTFACGLAIVIWKSRLWQTLRPDRGKRLAGFTVLLALLYPTPIYLIGSGMALTGILFPDSRPSLHAAFGSLLDGVVAPALGAFLIALPCWILTRKWDRRSYLLIALALALVFFVSYAVYEWGHFRGVNAGVVRQEFVRRLQILMGNGLVATLIAVWVIRARPPSPVD
jgi:hypothetical protein